MSTAEVGSGAWEKGGAGGELEAGGVVEVAVGGIFSSRSHFYSGHLEFLEVWSQLKA